jgi:hypothetical protein
MSSAPKNRAAPRPLGMQNSLPSRSASTHPRRITLLDISPAEHRGKEDVRLLRFDRPDRSQDGVCSCRLLLRNRHEQQARHPIRSRPDLELVRGAGHDNQVEPPMFQSTGSGTTTVGSQFRAAVSERRPWALGSNVAPPMVDNAAATLFERAASAAPATPPISAASTQTNRTDGLSAIRCHLALWVAGLVADRELGTEAGWMPANVSENIQREGNFRLVSMGRSHPTRS